MMIIDGWIIFYNDGWMDSVNGWMDSFVWCISNSVDRWPADLSSAACWA